MRILVAVLAATLLVLLLRLWLWFFREGGRRVLLPPQRNRAVSWNALAILLVYFFVEVAWPGFFFDFLDRIGLFTWLGPLGVSAASSGKMDLETTRKGIWVSTVAFPFQLVSVPLFLRAIGGSQLYQLGLSTHRLGRNLVLGVLSWALTTPLVYAVVFVVELLYRVVLHLPTEKHQLTELSALPLRDLEWALLAFSAAVAAPVMEELLFRGVLQPWLARRRWGGDLAVGLAVVVSVLLRFSKIKEALRQPDLVHLAAAWAPFLFVLHVVPLYLLVRARARSAVPPALFGTALLFAMMHSTAWPSPVPLLLLGLVLGWLAYRTQSLVASITLHALFNGVACTIMLVAHFQGTKPLEKGRDTTSAVRFSEPSVTSTPVPGSQLPRRR